MPDNFAQHQQKYSGPATRALSVTPNDSTDLANVARALWVGTGGNLNLLLIGDTSPVVFANVPSGTLLPVRAKRVYATSTTATGIVAID